MPALSVEANVSFLANVSFQHGASATTSQNEVHNPLCLMSLPVLEGCQALAPAPVHAADGSEQPCLRH